MACVCHPARGGPVAVPAPGLAAGGPAVGGGGHGGAITVQVEAIRAAKLAEMEAAGIPAKYRAELANKKLVNF